jgi:hypothetical protein
MKLKLFILLLLSNFYGFSQNTFGTILIEPDVFEAYTLISINNKSFLFNNCGEVINEWQSNYLPGNAVYLLENGNLLRTGRTNSTTISFGGRGGVIEKYSWEGDLIWQFFYDTPQYRQHHDVYPMPNGNVLILAATLMTEEEAIQAGRNPALLPQGELYNQQIIEVTPLGFDSATIVWEWNIKDHLIQDFDNTKDNFGNVGENPNKVDLNFVNGLSGNANWLHFNSIQYDEVLDQIVISSRNLSEIYIIDHSTTTAEAATGNGGIYGKGGDLLYRWGNPQAYRQGNESARKLFGQHYPHRIPQGLNNAGKIILFNNGNGRTPLFSEVFIIDTPFDSPGFYSYESNTMFGPASPDYIYVDNEDVTNFYSPILSSAQVLPNGNILICSGGRGVIFEINPNEELVWKYIVPVNNETGAIAEQGQTTQGFLNQTFRAIKYAPDYPAFTAKDLTSGNPIELNPDLTPCNNLSTKEFTATQLKIWPNPSNNYLHISTNGNIGKIQIFNVFGKNVLQLNATNLIEVSNFETGIYFLQIELNNNTMQQFKFIKL